MAYLPRDLEAELLSLWEKKRFFIIEGPRRSGKTTLLKRLQSLKGGTYISFDSPAERVDFLRDPTAYLPSKGEGPYFLDEIQYLGEEGAQALKLIYDQTPHRVVASGSGAFSVKMKLKAYMVGRAYFKTLLPLSFGEFVRWREPNLFSIYQEGHAMVEAVLRGEGAEPPEPSERLKALFHEYAVYGGYPEVVLKGREELLQIANTAVEEDILHYFSRLDAYKVWNVVRRLAAIAGEILRYSTLGVSQRTAEHYLSIFSYAHLIYLLTPYFTNPLKELTKSPKVFFYDVGIRNALIGNLSPLEVRPDRGQVVEVAVARQLVGERLHYWRTKSKAEVDLVVVRERPIPVEVKAGEGRITRSLLSFIESYRPPTAVVVGYEPSLREKGGVPIYTIPPYYF